MLSINKDLVLINYNENRADVQQHISPSVCRKTYISVTNENK